LSYWPLFNFVHGIHAVTSQSSQSPASPSTGSAFAGKFIHRMNLLIRLTQLHP